MNGLSPAPCHPYSVLLPVGFTLPPLSPAVRWALTPPFHPYHAKHGGLLSVALSLGSPPPDVIRHRISVEPGLSSPYRLSTLVKRGCPANWHGLHNHVPQRKPPKSDVKDQRNAGVKSVEKASSAIFPSRSSRAPSRPISSELFAAVPLPPVRTAMRGEAVKPMAG